MWQLFLVKGDSKRIHLIAYMRRTSRERRVKQKVQERKGARERKGAEVRDEDKESEKRVKGKTVREGEYMSKQIFYKEDLSAIGGNANLECVNKERKTGEGERERESI